MLSEFEIIFMELYIQFCDVVNKQDIYIHLHQHNSVSIA